MAAIRLNGGWLNLANGVTIDTPLVDRRGVAERRTFVRVDEIRHERVLCLVPRARVLRLLLYGIPRALVQAVLECLLETHSPADGKGRDGIQRMGQRRRF